MNDSFDETELSRDAFLGGKLQIYQPKAGYRAGVDPVLLAASVDAKPGQRVLDLGCGAGVAGLCLGRRVAGLSLMGLELQPAYADLARQNARANSIAMQVVTGDLSHMPERLRQLSFDHVIANPPYFDRNAGTAAQNAGRELALGETAPLENWIKAAAKRAAPRGRVTFIQRADRLPELFSAAMRHLGSLEVLPLIPRHGQAARLVLFRGRKGGRAGFRLLSGWVLHSGDAHEGDRENYTAATVSILRQAASLPFSS